MNKLIVNTKVIDIADKSIIIENNTIFVNNKKYVTNLNNTIIQFDRDYIIVNCPTAEIKKNVAVNVLCY